MLRIFLHSARALQNPLTFTRYDMFPSQMRPRTGPNQRRRAMTNPFDGRTPALSDPSADIMPITPSDTMDLPEVGIGLYVETGGAVSIVTPAGQHRTLNVADFSILPVGIVKVMASGTTASGLHAFVVA